LLNVVTLDGAFVCEAELSAKNYNEGEFVCEKDLPENEKEESFVCESEPP